MLDDPPSEARSRNMGQVKGKNTSPELIVRKAAHALGYRYRLHSRVLPGSPDLVFGSRRKVVFVHGCFWHRHTNCKRASMPATRKPYWESKFARNVARDAQSIQQLEAAGWQVLVLWECSLKDGSWLNEQLRSFLN